MISETFICHIARARPPEMSGGRTFKKAQKEKSTEDQDGLIDNA